MAFLAVLPLVGFLGVLGHIFSSTADHDEAHCRICPWFHVETYPTVVPALSAYLTVQILRLLRVLELPPIFPVRRSSRSPPLR